MGSEPSEEAVTNFVNFTSTSREQAVKFLKVSAAFVLALSLSTELTVMSVGQRPEFAKGNQRLF